MDRNWRVFITVANSSAPYARIVCTMNSWPVCVAQPCTQLAALLAVPRALTELACTTSGKRSGQVSSHALLESTEQRVMQRSQL